MLTSDLSQRWTALKNTMLGVLTRHCGAGAPGGVWHRSVKAPERLTVRHTPTALLQVQTLHTGGRLGPDPDPQNSAEPTLWHLIQQKTKFGYRNNKLFVSPGWNCWVGKRRRSFKKPQSGAEKTEKGDLDLYLFLRRLQTAAGWSWQSD